MKFLRFIAPFLFARNWQSGMWEISHPRVLLFVLGVILCGVGVACALYLQTPVQYSKILP